MITITTNIGAEVVTISEALKRLAKLNLTPARQSFYDAVNTGKILEVTDKENNPDGKRMVSWASVLEYIEHGGFKPRNKTAVTNGGETKTALITPAPEVPNFPDEGAALETGNPKPANPESPPILPGKMVENRSAGNDVVKRHPAQNSKGKQKTTPPPERLKPKNEGKCQDGENPKGRRSPPLRVIKNGLRHLGFEDTKAIRDWADNRLLNVLRPAQLQIESNAKDDDKQPA